MNFKVFYSSIVKRGIIYSLRMLYYEQIFDKCRNTRTSIDGNLAQLTNNYMPSSYLLVSELFDRLTLVKKAAEIRFVDFGSGKGRVLMIAIEKGIETVYGIENSRYLHECAKANLDKYKNRFPLSNIVLENGDAIDFEIPRGANTFFLYNPFSSCTLNSVMKKVVCCSEDVYMVYLNPLHHEIVLQHGFHEIFRLRKRKYTEAIIYKKNWQL